MKKLASLLVLPLLALALLIPGTAAAANWVPFNSVSDACKGKAADSAVCTERTQTADPITGANGLILNIVDIVAMVSGFIVVIMIILAGLRLVTANGSSEDVAGARRTLIYAVVGIVVIVLARTLVAFILSKL